MKSEQLIEQIIAKHIAVYNAEVPAWTGFAISCWFGEGERETVKYYYDSPNDSGKQIKTPSVYGEFRELRRSLEAPDTVHAVIISYVRNTRATEVRTVRDLDEAAKYQNWLGNPFDIAEAIRPAGV